MIRRARSFRCLWGAVVLAFGTMAADGGTTAAAGHTNRLSRESSPYLLQHQHNPVDWYPWSDEAFEKARTEGKPVFLSIGYSTCHWCHVMERESFENAAIAALLNRDFVSIKVDREERPDIDNVYMIACQLLTRSGGWPLTAILTPAGLPFFAGTYFPADDRYGRMGMRTLLPRLAQYWKEHRGQAETQAEEIAGAVRHAVSSPPKESVAPLDGAFFRSLGDDLGRRFDPVHGGFSDAPKFPPHGALDYLLRRLDADRTTGSGETTKAGDASRRENHGDSGRRGNADATIRRGNADATIRRENADESSVAMLRKTLDAMQDGGVFDHVGGGFHRYSVDAEWFIPHFEKMLYDNAQLLSVYAAAARRFGDARYRETALRIVEWLEREMRTPEGAYASALDADSEGVEGKYYLWTSGEIDAVLGPGEAPLYRQAFGIEAAGNAPPEFEEGRGKNLPRRIASTETLVRRHSGDAAAIERRLAADQRKLESVRDRRVHPARDDKVLTAWNALAISALATASRDLAEPRLLAIAERVARFLVSTHVTGDRVWHGSRDGVPKIDGFLEDDAFLIRALLDLAEVSGDAAHRDLARRLADGMRRRFADSKRGGFFQTAAPAGERGFLDLAKEYLDQVVPSPNGVAADDLRRLDAIEPNPEFREAARRAIESGAPYARAFPSAATTLAAVAHAASDAGSAPGRPPSEATTGPVRVSARMLRDSAGETTIAVRFVLDPGWHVQSRHPTRPDLVATRVEVRAAQGWRMAEPSYPAARIVRSAGEDLSVYSGEFQVTARAEPTAGVPPPSSLAVEVEFQACDASRCLAPQRLALSAGAPGDAR